MALLKVSNVSKSYDGRKIIDNINLETFLTLSKAIFTPYFTDDLLK